MPPSPFTGYDFASRFPSMVTARVMLLIMFGLSLAIIIASAIRRPVLLWQKGALLLAVITLLAVCVAWGIESVLQRA